MKKLLFILLLLFPVIANSGLLTGQTPANVSPPSGWSLVRTQDFEGSCPGDEWCGRWNGGINSAKPHTGSQSIEGTYSNDQSDFGWNLNAGSIGDYNEVYVSWYEWVTAGAQFNDEYWMFQIKNDDPFQEVIGAWLWAPTYNNAQAELYFVGQGVYTNRYGGLLGDPAEGAWVQWEVHYKPNTSGNSDGFIRVYKDGSEYLSSNNVTLNGSRSMDDSAIQIGGTYTLLSWSTNHPTCTNAGSYIGDGTDYCMGEMNWWGQSFSSPHLHPSLSSFKRYIDDIIVMKSSSGGGGGDDTAPPYVSNRSPASGSTGVDTTNRIISFYIKDDRTNDAGTVLSSISVDIEGTPYTCASGLSCVPGTSSAYSYSIFRTMGSDWSNGQVVNVAATAQDVSGNTMYDAWSFTAASSPGTLAITTTTLPNGKVDNAYSQQLSATNGTTPYTWSIDSAPYNPGYPYAPSTDIVGVTWDFANAIHLAPGTDLWPMTWATDNNVYTVGGDGGGFGGTNNTCRARTIFASITDDPPSITATNISGCKADDSGCDIYNTGHDGACDAPYAASTTNEVPGSIIAIGNTMYTYGWTFTNPPTSTLRTSSDLGQTWSTGGAATCDTNSTVVTQATADDDYDVWLSGDPLWKNTRGQSFTVPSNITLYSITVSGLVNTGGSCNLTLRVGNGADLTSYTAQVTSVACIDNTIREYEFVFTQPGPTLTAGSTYYFGVSSDATSSGDAFYISRTASDVYANGTAWKTISATWVMDDQTSTRDLTFKINKCDGDPTGVVWTYATGNPFFGAFVNVNAGHSGETYVYMTGGKIGTVGTYLARVPVANIATLGSYEYFSGTPSSPAWSSTWANATQIFYDGNGNMNGMQMTYFPVLGKYIGTVSHGIASDDPGDVQIQALGVFEAPQPWGPWKTVYYTDSWGNLGTKHGLNNTISAKWLSGDNKEFYMVYSGPDHDGFNLVKGTFTLAAQGQSLPAGLSLTTDGLIHGIPVPPPATGANPVTTSFTVTATDSANPPATDTQDLSITIYPYTPGGDNTVVWSSIQDTFITEGSHAVNWSTDATNRVYTWPSYNARNKTIVMDNDTLSLPNNVTVNSAVLRLYMLTYDGSGGYNPATITAHSLSGTLPTISTVTWDSFAATVSSALDTKSVSLVPQWVEWNVTSAVAAAYAARQPIYFLLQDTADIDDTNRIFASMENTTEAYRPHLVINYTNLVGSGGPSIPAPGKMRVTKMKGTFR